MLGAGTWTLHGDDMTAQVAVGSRYTLNSAGLMRRLATLGQGIVIMPEAVVADDVAAGRLVRILPAWQGKPVPVYAITETRLLPAKTQRFIEFLRERLAGPSTNPSGQR
jgi:DNA-binding transcriptional LysR family regulator